MFSLFSTQIWRYDLNCGALARPHRTLPIVLRPVVSETGYQEDGADQALPDLSVDAEDHG